MEQTFNIFGTKWKIIYCDRIDLDGDSSDYGVCDYTNKLISIATKRPDGTDENPREIHLTLLHELVHAICREGAYNEYTQDEPFVEWMAKCILSLLEQDIITKQ